MVLFACDLDQTLLYSSSKSSVNDICVELRKKKAITFITPKSHRLLLELQKRLCFVPVTTRTLTQYRRIHLFKDTNIPPYALVDNGFSLLINNELDIQWQKQSEEFALAAQPAMAHGYNLLLTDSYRTHSIQRIKDTVIFTRSKNPTKTIRRLLSMLDTETVAIQQNNSYIYLVPQTLNKGFALKRLLALQPADYIIGAGDALFDVPMLRLCNSCYVPSRAFANKFLKGHPHVYYPSNALNRHFSDDMLESILKRLNQNEWPTV